MNESDDVLLTNVIGGEIATGMAATSAVLLFHFFDWPLWALFIYIPSCIVLGVCFDWFIRPRHLLRQRYNTQPHNFQK